MFGLTTRGQLDPITQLEFERLYARLTEFLTVSFNEDGSLITAAPSGTVPIGADMGWWTDTPPDKWIFLEGQELNRVTYKALFELWGTTFGAGDGSTTFNVPDARGRFALCKASSGTGSVLGETGGTLDHTHTLPGHNHNVTVSGTTGANGGHSHSASGSSSTDGSHTHATGAHQHAVNSGGISVAEADDGSPPAIAVYAATDTTILSDSGTGSGGSHTHSISVSVDAVGDHTHSFSGTGSTDSTSSDDSDGANPPYIVNRRIVYTGVSA